MIFGRRQTTDAQPQGRRARRARAAQNGEAEPSPQDALGGGRPGGLRITEGLLPIFGPAQVGDSTAPLRPASEAERSRDRALRTTLTRVVGADGTSYVVAVPDDLPDELTGRHPDEPAAGQTGAPGA